MPFGVHCDGVIIAFEESVGIGLRDLFETQTL